VLGEPSGSTPLSSTHSDDGIRLLADGQPPLPSWRASSGQDARSVSLYPVHSAIDLRCRTPEQNEHKTTARRVCYPWHPQYGKDVIVRGQIARRQSALRCQVDDDDKRDNREIPEWMFDQVLCSHLLLSSQPSVSWEALVELRRLLDESGMTDAGEKVEHWSPPTKEVTGAQTTQKTTQKPADRTVRSCERPAKVAGHSIRCTDDGDEATCPDIASTPASGSSCTGGGA
jgi:hypothetical protein